MFLTWSKLFITVFNPRIFSNGYPRSFYIALIPPENLWLIICLTYWNLFITSIFFESISCIICCRIFWHYCSIMFFSYAILVVRNYLTFSMAKNFPTFYPYFLISISSKLSEPHTFVATSPIFSLELFKWYILLCVYNFCNRFRQLLLSKWYSFLIILLKGCSNL